MVRRRSQSEFYTFVDDVLVHPKPEIVRARLERDRQLRERLAGIMAPMLSADGNGTPGKNGTPSANGKAQPAGNATTVATEVDGDRLPAGAASRARGAVAATASNRGAGGRFVAGNKAASGNPFHRAVAARRKALLDAVSPDDIAKVGKKLCELALAGDVAAAKVLLAYVVGKPAEVADPDRLDADEVRLLLEGPDIRELLKSARDRVPADLAAQVVAGLLPANPERIAGLISEPHASRSTPSTEDNLACRFEPLA